MFVICYKAIFLPSWSYCFEKIWVFGSLRISLLCIMGELAGGRSVGVGISDVWRVSGDTRHVPRDTWRMTHDIWHLTHVKWHMAHDIFSFLFFFFFFLSFRFCPFWYRCYYLHTSRYSVSPVCGICIQELLSVLDFQICYYNQSYSWSSANNDFK